MYWESIFVPVAHIRENKAEALEANTVVCYCVQYWAEKEEQEH